MPESTIRRFEDTGEISLRQLLMSCDVYGNSGAAESLFSRPGHPFDSTSKFHVPAEPISHFHLLRGSTLRAKK